MPAPVAESGWNAGGQGANQQGEDSYRSFDKKQNKPPSKAEEDDIDRFSAVFAFIL